MGTIYPSENTPRDSFSSTYKVSIFLSCFRKKRITLLFIYIRVSMAGEAEAGLERLHQCAEKELHSYLTEDASQDAFNNFRTKLAGLTRSYIVSSFQMKTINISRTSRTNIYQCIYWFLRFPKYL